MKNENAPRFNAKLCLIFAALAMAAVASATDPIAGDYSTAINAFQVDSVAMLAAAAGPALKVLITFLGLAVAWRLLKRASKSI